MLGMASGDPSTHVRRRWRGVRQPFAVVLVELRRWVGGLATGKRGPPLVGGAHRGSCGGET